MISCLVIDDNSFDRKMLRRAAENCELRFNLCEAVNIHSAETILKSNKFDLIIIDFVLPDGDGLSFARRFLATVGSQFPMIMLTGKGSEQIVREAFQLGILDYLTKESLSPESLERVVINALAKIQFRRARQAAQDELKRANEALRRFAIFVAHDLKAPIRHIKTSCGSLGEHYRDILDKDGQNLLRRTERAADRAYKMIDCMLDYADLGKTSKRRDQVDLRLTIDDAMANLGDLIETAGTTTEIGDLPTVLGIGPQLTQLFQNLFSNAFKFRDLERGLVIRIHARLVSENAWEVSVEDNGIGVAPDDQERIFNMLERVHGQDRYEGSGIGLAACKRIVENHGGRIWCRSVLGAGSVFVFTLNQGEARPR